MNIEPLQVARWCLGFSWVYHGLAPKLIHIAPLERELTATFGFGVEISNLITRSAGVAEVLFGAVLIIFYRCAFLHVLSIIGLGGLLVFSAFMLPSILIEAFNPVGTNLCMIALSYYLWFESREFSNGLSNSAKE